MKINFTRLRKIITSMQKMIRIILIINRKSIQKFYNDRCFIISNGLAFKTLFALIPISGIFIIILTIFPPFTDYKEKVIELVRIYFIPETVNIVIEWLNHFLDNLSAVSVIGIIALIYISLDLFITLDNQVNQIWSSRIKRTLIQKVLIYWAILTITPIMLAGYFYYSGLIRSLISSLVLYQHMDEVYYSFFTFLLLTGFFFFLIYIVPNIKVHILKALFVAIMVSLIWNLLRILFTYYTQLAITNWKIYGSLAALIFFLLWISLNWMILLFGVELLQVWQEKLYQGDIQFKNFFLFDLGFFILILNELYQDFKDQGRGKTINQLATQLKYDVRDLRDIFKLFETENLVVRQLNDLSESFYLKKDISRIPLSDIEALIWKHLVSYQNHNLPGLTEICKRLNQCYALKDELKEVRLKQILMKED